MGLRLCGAATAWRCCSVDLLRGAAAAWSCYSWAVLRPALARVLAAVGPALGAPRGALCGGKHSRRGDQGRHGFVGAVGGAAPAACQRRLVASMLKERPPHFLVVHPHFSRSQAECWQAAALDNLMPADCSGAGQPTGARIHSRPLTLALVHAALVLARAYALQRAALRQRRSEAQRGHRAPAVAEAAAVPRAEGGGTGTLSHAFSCWFHSRPRCPAPGSKPGHGPPEAAERAAHGAARTS